MMKRYETLILAKTEITQDEIADIERQLEKAIKVVKGDVISFDAWGKCRLAYPIQHREYGLYFLLRYEVEKTDTLFEDFRALFAVKYSTIVMRTVTRALDARKPLAYQRPSSVEEAPARDVDTFLKENNMEGLFAKPQDAAVETVVEIAPQESVEIEAEEALS